MQDLTLHSFKYVVFIHGGAFASHREVGPFLSLQKLRHTRQKAKKGDIGQ